MQIVTRIVALLALTVPTVLAQGTMPQMQLPALLVSTATPTRSGPLSVAHTRAGYTRADYGLKGNVRQVTTVRKGTLGGLIPTTLNTVLKFSADGRLLSIESSALNGRFLQQVTFHYDGTRLTSEQKQITKPVVTGADALLDITTTTYTYTAAGDLSTATERDQTGKVTQISRYQALPNGYIVRTGLVGDGGPPQYVLQDAAGHILRSEQTGVGGNVVTNTYQGDMLTRTSSDSALDSVSFHISTTYTATGSRQEFNFIGEDTVKVITKSQPDRFGNPQVSTEEEERQDENGQVEREVVAVESSTYLYY